MKTNIDSHFLTDEKMEKEGIQFTLDDSGKVWIQVRRVGGSNSTKIKAIYAKYHKPYAYQIEKKLLSDEKSRELAIRVFVEACVVDWAGIVIDGAEVPYSPEAAIKLLLARPELADALDRYASNVENYREAVGNS